MKKNWISRVITLMLCAVLSIGCCIGAKLQAKVALADNEPAPPELGGDEPAYDEELINSYLSNTDITDEYIEEIDEVLVEKYEDYVHFDYDNEYHLAMDTTEIEEIYDIYDESLSWENFEGTNENDWFEISAVKMIRRNIQIMNDLVDEDLGYIDSNYEFIPYEDEEDNLARWRAWGLKIKWYKASVKFDADFAIVFAIGFLIGHLAVETLDLDDIIQKLLNDESIVEDVIMDAFFYIPNDIAASMVTEVTDNEVMGYLITLVPNIIQVLSRSNVMRTVTLLLMKAFLPDIKDCMIVLFNAAVLNKGMSLSFCWVTRKGKWGLSIKKL